MALAAAAAGILAIAAGPASYSIASVDRSLNGNNVLAGPASASQGGMGGPGGMRGGPGGQGGPMGTPPSGGMPSGAGAPPAMPGATSGTAGGSAASGGGSGAGSASAAGGAASAESATTDGGASSAGGTDGGAASGAGATASTAGASSGTRQGRGGMGGGSISAEVIAYLQEHQGSAKYLLAASGSQTTADVIIETGEPVVTIGGFGGSDPAPTVAQLAQMVQDGELKYVLVSSNGGGPGRGGSSALNAWVTAHGTAVTDVSVSGGTLYRVSAS